MFRFKFFSIALCVAAGYGQTMIDLRTQSKSVDFSAANTTKPFKSGTSFPATCTVGEMFYKSDAAAGSNVYGCTATNTWTLEGATSSGSSLPGMSGNSGKVLSTDGSNANWTGLGGDLSGSIGTATVTQIQGRTVSPVAPQASQALIWNATTSRWEPTAVSGGGGGGGGITMLSQAGDLVTARSSTTDLRIGGNCSAALPCNVRFGSLVYSITSGATATVTSGTGVAYVYVSSSGTLTVGHNISVNCTSGCFAQVGVTAFPYDAIPLFTWSATNGTWDVNGGADFRAFASTKAAQPGPGLTSIESQGKTTFNVDTTLIGLRASAPSTSSTACTTGSWAMDTSFYYLCVSTNAWRRASLASW